MCQKPYGKAASTKLNTVTHPYYDGILKAYTPAIDHGQDSGRGGRRGLGMKAHVQKLTNVTPRRKKKCTTPRRRRRASLSVLRMARDRTFDRMYVKRVCAPCEELVVLS